MTFCGDGVRAITRSDAGGVARSTGVGSMVTPKCDRATADECTTTAATISVNVVIAKTPAPKRFRRATLYGKPDHCATDGRVNFA